MAAEMAIRTVPTAVTSSATPDKKGVEGTGKLFDTIFQTICAGAGTNVTASMAENAFDPATAHQIKDEGASDAAPSETTLDDESEGPVTTPLTPPHTQDHDTLPAVQLLPGTERYREKQPHTDGDTPNPAFKPAETTFTRDRKAAEVRDAEDETAAYMLSSASLTEPALAILLAEGGSRVMAPPVQPQAYPVPSGDDDLVDSADAPRVVPVQGMASVDQGDKSAGFAAKGVAGSFAYAPDRSIKGDAAQNVPSPPVEARSPALPNPATVLATSDGAPAPLPTMEPPQSVISAKNPPTKLPQTHAASESVRASVVPSTEPPVPAEEKRPAAPLYGSQAPFRAAADDIIGFRTIAEMREAPLPTSAQRWRADMIPSTKSWTDPVSASEAPAVSPAGEKLAPLPSAAPSEPAARLRSATFENASPSTGFKVTPADMSGLVGKVEPGAAIAKTETRASARASAEPDPGTLLVDDLRANPMLSPRPDAATTGGFAPYDLSRGAQIGGEMVPSKSHDRGVFAENTNDVRSLRSLSAQLVSGAHSARRGMIEMRLAPEELGHIRVTLHSDTQLLRVVVESPETLQLMQRHADQLIRDLRREGVDNPQVVFEQGDGFGGGASSGQRQSQNSPAPARPAIAGGAGFPDGEEAVPAPIAVTNRQLAMASLDIRF